VTPLYPQKLALTSPTGGGRSVGIVRSRTKATEFSLYILHLSGKIPKIRIASLFVISYFHVIHSSPNLTRTILMNRYVSQSYREPKRPAHSPYGH